MDPSADHLHRHQHYKLPVVHPHRGVIEIVFGAVQIHGHQFFPPVFHILAKLPGAPPAKGQLFQAVKQVVADHPLLPAGPEENGPILVGDIQSSLPVKRLNFQ